MRDEPVSVSAVMMTAKGRARRRESGKCWGHWEVRNHYDWWWIRACTPRSYFASRRTWSAVQAPTIARYGHRRLEPMGTAGFRFAEAAGGSWSARIAMRWPRRWLVSRWNRGCERCTAATTLRAALSTTVPTAYQPAPRPAHSDSGRHDPPAAAADQNQPYPSAPTADAHIAQSSEPGPRTTFASKRSNSSACRRGSTTNRSGCELPNVPNTFRSRGAWRAP